MATDGTEKIVQRLTKHLDLSTRLRVVAKADPGTRKRRQHLRTWQAGRLARTHADLLASPRFGLPAAFFLTEVYSTKDVSKRDEEVKRALPAQHDIGDRDYSPSVAGLIVRKITALSRKQTTAIT